MFYFSYPGYWYNKDGDNYAHSNWYWHIIGARLAFVVVFEVTIKERSAV